MDDQSVVVSMPQARKDANGDVQLRGAGRGDDDTGVIVLCERMTEFATKDDRKDGKDDKSDVAYKEELFQKLIPEPSSTTTAPQEFPPEFASLVDEELPLERNPKYPV